MICGTIESLDDFWDAVTEPCGMTEWFGRSMDAWRGGNTMQTRGISESIDSYDVLVGHVDKHRVFTVRNREARALRIEDSVGGSRDWSSMNWP